MKILAISYSQTGQLHQIMDNFLAPLSEQDIDNIHYKPAQDFPFPWTADEFFDTMPETVMEKPIDLALIKFKYEKYDLIILGYQPWYLSPSLPVSALLQSEEFLARVKDTPVISLIGSRNMWINAQDSINSRVKAAGGKMIGNIPLIDRNHNLISVVTILHWMLKGEKTRKYNLFPKPGVSDKDIQAASQFGEILQTAITTNNFENLQEKFLSLGLIEIGTDILFIESKAKRIFRVWVKLIFKFGKTPKMRKILLRFFKYYLLIALFMVAPIVVSIYQLLITPFIFNSIKRRKAYICTKFE